MNSTSRMQRSGPLRRMARHAAFQSMGARGGTGLAAGSGVAYRLSAATSGSTISVITLSACSTSEDFAPGWLRTMAGTSVETMSPAVPKNCRTEEMWVRSW